MYIFSFSFPYYTKVTYYRYSLYFKFFHLKIIPGNHSLSVNKTYPHYFLLWHLSQPSVDVPGLVQPSPVCEHLSYFQCLQLPTMLQWINFCTCIFLLLELYLQGNFLEVKFLGQKLAANVILSDTIKLLSTRLVPIHISTSNVWECLR